VGDAAARLAAAARGAAPHATIALVRGPQATSPLPPGVEAVAGAASLAAELARADLVVCGAGQTALEAAATGAPAVVVPLAENQHHNAAALRAADAARVADRIEDVAAAVAELIGDAAARAALGARAQRAVDGYGAFRIAWAVERLARGEGTLRDP
jgi:UDP-N-acetylglucosamine:LPS N-acetylglucosamine transferase